ncbi:MAG TPA: DegQ family serine endoprotease [Nitrospirales bacterium]|nr:DegQ family serine endoprotease [Nitrospirales bacterium]
MSQILHRHLDKIAAAIVLGAALFLGGEYLTYSQAAGPATPAAASPATPFATAAAPGFAEVAKAVTPAVVNITSRVAQRHDRTLRDPMDEFFRSPFGPFGQFGPQGPMPPQEPRGGGMGSGVIVSPDGHIITNNHVVDGASELTVTLPDKREFKAKIVGTDSKTDLAVIKIDASNLPYVRWGDSSKLQVGEYVLAVGNPFGLNSTVTLGIVSALGRGHMGITQYEDFIQTDAAINPGNSGGALINTAGELVGINTAIVSQTGGYQGVGFAVPASMAKPVYESLVKTGKVVRGYLGVAIQDLTQDLAKSFGLKQTKGVLVSSVAEDSPAERAGIKQGDVIVAYQGKPIEDPAVLQREVTRTPVGTKAMLKVIRDGREQEVTVTIGEQSETVKVASADSSMQNALAGVEVQSLDLQTARELGLHGKVQGVVVVNVEPDSLADRAGLAQGDVIKEINRQPIKSVRDFERVVSSLKKDESVLLLISRRGTALFITVKA